MSYRLTIKAEGLPPVCFDVSTLAEDIVDYSPVTRQASRVWRVSLTDNQSRLLDVMTDYAGELHAYVDWWGTTPYPAALLPDKQLVLAQDVNVLKQVVGVYNDKKDCE